MAQAVKYKYSFRRVHQSLNIHTNILKSVQFLYALIKELHYEYNIIVYKNFKLDNKFNFNVCILLEILCYR